MSDSVSHVSNSPVQRNNEVKKRNITETVHEKSQSNISLNLLTESKETTEDMSTGTSLFLELLILCL